MARIPVINIVATNCQKEGETRFNEWYNEVHVPMLLKFKGMKAAARYRIMSKSADYPAFLTIYHFESKKSFQEFEKSLELAAAREERMGSWPGGLDVKWRVQYEFMRSWEEKLESPGKGNPVINFVGTRAKPEDELRFNKWYDEVHIPGLLKTGKVKAAVRYKITKENEDYPPYLTIYYFGNQTAYDEYFKHLARLTAIQEMEETWPNNQFDIVWRVQYQLLRSWRK